MHRAGRTIASLGLAAALLALAGCGAASDPERPDLLLITVDTLRADHVGPWRELCAGPDGPVATKTPAIDALAAGALVFEHAYTAIPITTPSLGSMLTGRLPRHHGALNNTDDLGPDVPTLPMALAELGYTSAAFLPTFLADKPGFRRGFDVYDCPTLGQPPLRGSEVVARALAWLDERAASGAEGPTFVWVHLVDPHAPYDPGPEFEAAQLAPLGLTSGDFPERLRHEVFRTAEAPAPEELPILRALYRAEVEATDAALAPLIERVLDRAPSEREQVTLFTADHGEMLAERRGYVGHTGYLHEQMLRVPFLIHSSRAGRAAPDPGLAAAPVVARRTNYPAWSLDVALTLQARAGGGVLLGIEDGALPLLELEQLGLLEPDLPADERARLLVHETFAPEGFFDQQAARLGAFVWVAGEHPERPTGFFDTSDDPGGLSDLLPTRADWSPYLEGELRYLESALPTWRVNQGPVRRPDGETDPALRSALDKIGYFGGGAAEPEASGSDANEADAGSAESGG